MRYIGMLAVVVGAVAMLGQQPAPGGKTTGPGVQAGSDAKEPDILKTCKTPPQARGGRGAGQGKGGPGRGAAKGPAPERSDTAKEITGVVAAGAKWKSIWEVDGNNADGIIGTNDGGLLVAQNDNSNVIKLDKNGKESIAYNGTNTGGSVAMNSKGAIFVANRGIYPSIEELSPKRQKIVEKFNGDPLDCIGVVMNDVTADSKGGVYFTMGTVYHSDAMGNVTKYGMNLNTNGIMLSADEKHLFVTNGGTLVEFDVEKDGSLSNQRDFAKIEGGGGDGSTFDSAGRFYVTSGAGITVISPDGKNLGVIPTPRGVISVAFSGPNRKTLYAVSREGNHDWIIGIPMIAQGAKGRGK